MLSDVIVSVTGVKYHVRFQCSDQGNGSSELCSFVLVVFYCMTGVLSCEHFLPVFSSQTLDLKG